MTIEELNTQLGPSRLNDIELKINMIKLSLVQMSTLLLVGKFQPRRREKSGQQRCGRKRFDGQVEPKPGRSEVDGGGDHVEFEVKRVMMDTDRWKQNVGSY